MNFHHEFEVPAPRFAVWERLMDVHQVTACIQGVHDLEVVDDDHYTGRIGVKMGPIALSFAGEVEVTGRDEANHTASLLAKAADRKAGGGFSSTMTMQLEAVGDDRTRVRVDLDTSLTGRLAQMGRSLIKKRVSGMLEDFAAAFSASTPAAPE